jgi:peroxiredoxin
MPSYEEDLSEFERRDAQVLGISVDNVPSNEAWAKSMGGLSYPLLSDFWPHGHVAALYGVLRGVDGRCERAIFVIDKQGKVAYVDIHDISEQPPTDKIMAALDKLKK